PLMPCALDVGRFAPLRCNLALFCGVHCRKSSALTRTIVHWRLEVLGLNVKVAFAFLCGVHKPPPYRPNIGSWVKCAIGVLQNRHEAVLCTPPARNRRHM